MEQLLPDLPPLVPSLGVLGLLSWLLVRVMRQSSSDRAGYQQAVADLREEHRAEIAALTSRYDGQIAELRAAQAEQAADLRAQMGTMRQELADLRVALEAERKARWEAEDEAARYRRLAQRQGKGDLR